MKEGNEGAGTASRMAAIQLRRAAAESLTLLDNAISYGLTVANAQGRLHPATWQLHGMAVVIAGQLESLRSIAENLADSLLQSGENFKGIVGMNSLPIRPDTHERN